MTWYSSKDVAYVFVGATDIHGYLNAATMKTTANLADTRVLGEVYPTITDTGLRSGEFTCSGFYDGTAAGGVMNTVSGTDQVVSVLLEGNTVSKRFYGYRAAIVSGSEIGLSSDNVHTSTPGITVRGDVDYGYVCAPYLADRGAGATTDATYANMGADAGTARAYLNITDITMGGASALTVTVRHCDTAGGAYGDHTAFAAVTAVGAQTIALASTVEQYISIKWAWTGGAGSKWSGFVGVAPLT